MTTIYNSISEHDRIIYSDRMIPIGVRPQMDPRLENPSRPGPAEAPSFPIEPPIEAGWHIDDVSIISVFTELEFSFNENNPSSILLNDDASKLFIYGNDTHKFYEYILSLAGDISTAELDAMHSFEHYLITSFCVGNSGTKLFCSMSQGIGGSVWEFDLNGEWDFSKITYSNRISIPGGGITDLFFSSNGYRMFVSNDSNEILRYEMSFSWNLDTAEFSQRKDFGSLISSIGGFVFNPEGSRVYVLQDEPGRVYQFTLETNWDLDTVSYDNLYGEVVDDIKFVDMFIHDENRVYMVTAYNNKIVQYVFVFPPVQTEPIYHDDPPIDDNDFSFSPTIITENILSDPWVPEETQLEPFNVNYTWICTVTTS